MKNILITTGIYPPDIGGPATYVKSLVKELPKRGYSLRVISFGENNNYFKEGDVEIFVINRNKNYLVKYLEYFKAIYKNLDWASTVYAQGPVCEGLPTMLACKLKKKKYFVKVVGDYAWEQYRQNYQIKTQKQDFDSLDDFQNSRYDFGTEIKRLVESRVVKNAIKVITPSNYLKKIVVGWGAKFNKVEVIYNSVEINEVKDSKNKLRNEFGFKNDEILVLTVGRLVPWKGMDVLIEVLVELKKETEKIKLLIVGNGPCLSDLKQKVRELKLDNFVVFIGKLEKEKVMKYMKASDMFVLNSAYEGLSHVLIEAMFMRIPVIASRVGGNIELINGNTGLLVDYNSHEQIIQAIIKMMNEKDMKEKYTKNAFSFISDKSNYKNMINQLVKKINA